MTNRIPLVIGPAGLSQQLQAGDILASTGQLTIVRSDIPSVTMLVNTIMLSGFAAAGDYGIGAIYTSVGATSGGAMAIQDAAGTWFNLDCRGSANAGWFGATGDSLTNDTAALLLWANHIANGDDYTGILNPGTFLLSQTLDFHNATVIGAGVEWQGGRASVLKANASNILMVKNGAWLQNFVIDGDGKALWGGMLATVRTKTTNLEVVHCKEYGCVLNATQNSTHTNLNCRMNKYNLVLANGARNTNFLNFTSSCENDAVHTASVDDRAILFLIDTSDPHGFGLSTSVTTLGNDRACFFGGISENIAGGIAAYGFESQNLSGYGSTTCNQLTFVSYEFDFGSVFQFDSTWTGNIDCYSCSFTGDGGSPQAFSSGAYGNINFHGFSYITSFVGSQEGIASGTNFYSIAPMKFNLTDFVSPPYGLSGGGGNVAYNAAARIFSITGGGSSVQGLSLPRDNVNTTGQRAAFIAAVKPIYKITFTVGSVVGGSGKINLYADLAGSPFRTLIAQYAAGTYEVFYQTVGTEQGTISFTYNDVTSFDVSGITLEYL